jgi:hypothetical protein
MNWNLNRFKLSHRLLIPRMFFPASLAIKSLTAVIILAPALVNAIPAVSERGTTTSDIMYTYVIPSDYWVAKPDAPAIVNFYQAQFDEFASLFPTEVASADHVVLTCDISVQHTENLPLEHFSDQNLWKKLKCWGCKGGCALLAEAAVTRCSEFFSSISFK